MVKKSKDKFTELVKNTYRVLFTRGMNLSLRTRRFNYSRCKYRHAKASLEFNLAKVLAALATGLRVLPAPDGYEELSLRFLNDRPQAMF